MNALTLEDRWKKFAGTCLPPTCSIVQYAETKKAFMCGFSDAFFLMDEISLLDEKAAFEKISKLKNDTMAYTLKTIAAMQKEGL